jgi:hypothetical protein
MMSLTICVPPSTLQRYSPHGENVGRVTLSEAGSEWDGVSLAEELVRSGFVVRLHGGTNMI